MIRRSFEVNVFGPMNTVKEFHPLLIKSKGLIAFTGSVTALMPFVFGSVYSSTKGAIHSYINSLALEVEPFGIRVLNLVTGLVESELGEDDQNSPKDSVYIIDGEDIYRESVGTFKHSKKMPTKVYAYNAVNDFEKALRSTGGTSKITYRGASSSIVWLADKFMPRCVLKWVVYSSFNLKGAFDKLRSRYQ